jgi:hypothetical protein
MSALDVLWMSALSAPFLAIIVLLVYYQLKRTTWNWNRRRGKESLGFCPSSAALGTIFLLAQVFTRPSIAHFIEARQLEDVDEDDDGDPDVPDKHLDRQLRKIRRGQPIDGLILRL